MDGWLIDCLIEEAEEEEEGGSDGKISKREPNLMKGWEKDIDLGTNRVAMAPHGYEFPEELRPARASG